MPDANANGTAAGAAGGLEVQGLTVRYRGGVALNAVTFDVPVGGRVAVVGRNGAGKSSLVRALAGVVPAAAGRVLWRGEDVTRCSPHGRVSRGISLVPEGRRIFGHLTVATNLRVGGFTNKRDVSARREEMYELFPALRERSRTHASQLSGGEAQMLAIGLALMANPKLVMLDEPSFGLAPVIVGRVLETIRTLSEQGITVLLVEQSVRLALALAETVYVLDQGELRLAAAPGQKIDEDALHAAYLGSAVS